ncbi:hypothetical protein DDZ18_06870 [Marinicauda salina]|uniref:Uncharacterized protein n=1 Tax=Marinicauda salina TaxID=2135793 RepID=A0A2U2BTS4_9PROT|nr:hypothetical protein [Marinicauda salina]PWE17400.1 hypothetical protein DDZ18_06870 [Marinicauda salina]
MPDDNMSAARAGGDAARTQLLRDIFLKHGFRASSSRADVEDAIAIGTGALGDELADADDVLACERKTERCFFIRRGEDGAAEGFIALLYLNAAGFEALMHGRFTPASPSLDHLTEPDEPAAALYPWCVAAADDVAKRALSRAITEARRRAFYHIPLFARPMSREGRMVIASLDSPKGPPSWLGWLPQRPEDGLEHHEGGPDGRFAA